MYTSKQILKMDELYDIQERAGNGVSVKYWVTDDEIGWLDFVRGRYSIADWMDENMIDGVLSIESIGLSDALDNDCGGFGKAVCLSDETALQKLFFWCYIDEGNNQGQSNDR